MSTGRGADRSPLGFTVDNSWGQFPLGGGHLYEVTLKFSPADSRRHVQQQCQQQLNYRQEGGEAAPFRGQYPEDQGNVTFWTPRTDSETRKTELA